MNEFPAYETLAVDMADTHVLRVIMNRPQSLNAMNERMAEESLDLMTRLLVNDSDVRCVVLSGAGGSFSSGADLKARDSQSRQEFARQHALAERITEMRLNSAVPWIAAVEGVCYAGGLEAALTCDFIYASTEARFAFTECRLGLMPGTMGTQTLPRAVGERRAKELILSARPFTASEASAWGMVNELCAPGTTLARATEVAQRIATNAPLAVRQAKKSIHVGMQTDLHTAYRFELEAWYRLLDTQDRAEGIRAFVEKRAPRFQGQ